MGLLLNRVVCGLQVLRTHSELVALTPLLLHKDQSTKKTLLYDFLNELIFYYDDQDLLLQHVVNLEIKEVEGTFTLRASLSGDTKGSYDIRTEIKSMTYSDMEITNGCSYSLGRFGSCH